MFNMKFFLLLLLASTLYAKKDFYYNFINPDLTQISQEQKRKIVGASDKIKEIRRYIREGQLDVALKNIVMFRDTNQIEMLNSQAVLLQSEILYKINSVTKAAEANDLLEAAINNSEISQDDLLEAYRLLVLIKIKLNKTEEGEYYAKAIENSFDDPLSKVYGKVALSQIHVKRRDYRKAIKILRQELINTTSLEVATIVADELYDAYILNDQKDEAYDLVQKVLNRNIDYYANDSYKALKKVDKLVDADMSEFAIEILQKLIENSIHTDSIDNFRFKLADVYMQIAGFQKEYLPKAKQIYEDLQHYIAEKLQPWALMTVGFGQSAYPETTRPQRNTLGYQYIFPWGWKDTDTIFTDSYLESWCTEGATAVRDYWPDLLKLYGDPMGANFDSLYIVFIAIIFVIFCCTITKTKY